MNRIDTTSTQAVREPAMTDSAARFQNLFGEVLNRLGAFADQLSRDPARTAMLAEAIAEAWLIDEKGIDIDSPLVQTELVADKRLRTGALLQSYYGDSRSKQQIQRDLMPLTTSISRNIFTRDLDRLAQLVAAVSEYVESPSEDGMGDILEPLLESLQQQAPSIQADAGKLTSGETAAVSLAAAWAARVDMDCIRFALSQDASVILSILAGSAAALEGISRQLDAGRMVLLWTAFIRELQNYDTEAAHHLRKATATDEAVTQAAMTYAAVTSLSGELLAFALNLRTDPESVLFPAAERLAAQHLGRVPASRKRVQ